MSVSFTYRDTDYADATALLKLGQGLDELHTDGYIYDDKAGPSESKRIRISRTYLWLLGYLKTDNKKSSLDSVLTKALKAFQLDMELAESGSLDDDTWGLLRSLLSYDSDSPSLPLNRLTPGKLQRAAHVRLFSYGLVNRLPSAPGQSIRNIKNSSKDLQAGLLAFAQVATMLGITKEPLSPDLNNTLIHILFDHNGLVRSMPKEGDIIRYKPPPKTLPLSDREQKKLVTCFLEKLITVEIWLLGYEVRPGNIKTGTVHSREQTGTLKYALGKFASDRNLKRADKSPLHCTWFFREVEKMQSQSVEADETIDDKNLNHLISDKKQMKSLRKQYRNLGARIIDGVKKVVFWVVGFFRKLFRAVKQLIRNIARILHRAALAIYRRLQLIFEAAKMGFRYFFSNPIHGSDPENVYIIKRADFDMDAIINSNARIEKIDAFFSGVDWQVKAMLFSAKIINLIWRILKTVIRVTTAAVDWLGLIIVLVKLKNIIQDSITLSKEAKEIVQGYQAYS